MTAKSDPAPTPADDLTELNRKLAEEAAAATTAEARAKRSTPSAG